MLKQIKDYTIFVKYWKRFYKWVVNEGLKETLLFQVLNGVVDSEEDNKKFQFAWLHYFFNHMDEDERNEYESCIIKSGEEKQEKIEGEDSIEIHE